MSSSGEEASAARERGNAFFKAQKYNEANIQYAEALEKLSQTKATSDDARAATRDAEHKCRLNRAACLLKLQGYGAASMEAHAVIQDDPTNAKAHFRLAQGCEALGDLARARAEYAEAIKLNPGWREPRELLEALRARCKEQPRLEQALQDITTVESRALKALNFADVKGCRQQFELVLKDARSNKFAHWEVRALLGLALLCQDEGESEGAQDYLDAGRRKLDEKEDK